MSDPGDVELIEVTTVQTDAQLGVLERKYAYKSRGRATAVIELTIFADRADDCSPVLYTVRYHVNPGDGWRQAKRSREEFEAPAEAIDTADKTWKMLMTWIRAITPVPPRKRVGAAEDCSCHES